MDQSLAHYFYKKALYSRRFPGVDLSLTVLCKCTGNPCVRDTSPQGLGLQKHVKGEEGAGNLGQLPSPKLEFQDLLKGPAQLFSPNVFLFGDVMF